MSTDLLQQLSQVVIRMQPVAEAGEILSARLRQLDQLSNVILATYDEAQHVLRFVTVTVAGRTETWPSVSADTHPLGDVVRRRKPSTIAAGILGRHSWLAFPLYFGGSNLGVLAVGPARSARRQRQLLQGCAHLLAISVYLEAHAEQLELMFAEHAITLAGISDIAQQLNATLDQQQIIELVLVYALALPSIGAGAVLTLEGEQTVVARVQRGVEPALASQLQRQSFSLAQFQAFDLHQEYQLVPRQQLPAAVQLAPTTELYALLPLRRDASLSGLIVLAPSTKQHVTPIQVQFLKQLAAHAALALSNANAYTAIQQQRELLDSRLAQLQAVARISQAISAHLYLDALLVEIVNVVQTTLGYGTALLSLVDMQAPTSVRQLAAVGVPEERWRVLREQVVPLDDYQMLMAEEFRISRSFFIPRDQLQGSNHGSNPAAEPHGRRASMWNTDDLLLVPLYGHRGGLVGFLSVNDSTHHQRPTAEAIAVLEIFATQAATAIENAQLYANLEQQALTDNLTGLANQRHFMIHLEQQISYAERHGHELALLALDIDYFKSFNDNFGHLAGNVVLREFANIMRQTVRTGDQVARWGGEEFLALLPESSRDGALEVAERIRLLVQQHTFPHRSVSVSIGVAVFNQGMSGNDLLGAADAALYRAKATRDTVAL